MSEIVWNNVKKSQIEGHAYTADLAFLSRTTRRLILYIFFNRVLKRVALIGSLLLSTPL